MEIKVNGANQKVEAAAANVGRLLQLQQVESPDMVAVQVNGKFVAREAYDSTWLKADDDVEFLYFMGGGA